MPTRDQILEALKVVIDPELHRSIVELGMVRSIDVKDQGVVDVTVSLTTPGCPIKSHFQNGVASAVQALPGVARVNVAAALTAEGKKVGVLDADVWGYSIPRMLGLSGRKPSVNGERKILPLD